LVATSHILKRNINHWESEGLLLKQARRGIKWRKFSLIDLLWINIIAELRSFGCPIKTIKAVKKALFHKETFESVIYFEIYLLFAFQKDLLSLVINKEGKTHFSSEDSFAYHTANFGKPSPDALFIININSLLQKIKSSPKNKAGKEEEVLDIIKNEKDVSEVIIRVKENKIERIDYTKQIKNPRAVRDILFKEMKKRGHKEYYIKQEGEKIALFKQINKIK
jgi:DNA-binding transcriptional MerR regulator